MDILAIIPARGGSKGIPRKNVLPLLDRPLIAHTICAAQDSRQITRVVVSTDDDEIALVARDYGAQVVMRPEELATDVARSEDALLHVLERLRVDEDYRPDLVVFLQCTSPLTSSDDIDGTIDTLLAKQADTALAVVPFHYFLWAMDGEGGAIGINHDKTFRLMRQQRAPEFLETGSVYVMKTEGFLKAGFRFFGKTAMHEISVEHWHEIDEPADFRIAEDRLRRLSRDRRGDVLPKRVRALVMDFDGVHTNDLVSVSTNGEESVTCSRSDGMGIEILRKAGVAMTVLSKEANAVVAKRCAKLQLECTQGVENKLPLMLGWLEAKGIDPAECIYIGNDVNDLECMAFAGLAVAPRDAHSRALEAAGLVLSRDGGRGALRELADILTASGVLCP